MCHCGSCGSSAIVPSYLRGYFVGSKFFLVGVSWVQHVFLWVFCRSKYFFSQVFRGSKMFSRGYFVGPKFFSWVFYWSVFFLVGSLWVQLFFYFVDPNFFLGGILWGQSFISWVFHGSDIFFLMINFAIQRFLVVRYMRKVDRKQNYINTSQTTYSIPIDFNNCQFCLY